MIDWEDHLLEYKCMQTGFSGAAMACIARADAEPEGRVKQAVEEDAVFEILRMHGPVYGTSFEEISAGLIMHMAEHQDCASIYQIMYEQSKRDVAALSDILESLPDSEKQRIIAARTASLDKNKPGVVDQFMESLKKYVR